MSYITGNADGYLDLLDILDNFLTATGHCWGLTYAGVGNGTLTGYIGTASSVAETITCTATSASNFDVVGSVSGALGSATVGSPYSGSKCEFTITAGGTAFQSGDEFVFNTSPKWTPLRKNGMSEIALRFSDITGYAALFDKTTGGNLTPAVPCHAGIQCDYASTVKSIRLSGYTAGRGPKDFELQWSDNGSTWNTQQSWTGEVSWQTQETRYYAITSPSSHAYWRIYITAYEATALSISEIGFYGDAAHTWNLADAVEFGWLAPGVTGDQNIYVGGYTYSSATGDVWNLIFRGFRYWDDYGVDGSILNIPTQAGNGQDLNLNLSKTTFAYWIIAHGSRVIILARISGVYQSAYFGYGLPYETPADHPYPMVLVAPDTTKGNRYSHTDATPRFIISPYTGAAHAMTPSGVWYAYANRAAGGSGSNGSDASSAYGKFWPNATRDAGTTVDDLRDAIDGSMPVLPVVLYQPDGLTGHAWGELDGVYWTTGFNNAAEALLDYGAIKLIVWLNAYRTSIYDYCAIALD
jgi:hypothetical protein